MPDLTCDLRQAAEETYAAGEVWHVVGNLLTAVADCHAAGAFIPAPVLDAARTVAAEILAEAAPDA